jgi:hypothetical protein
MCYADDANANCLPPSRHVLCRCCSPPTSRGPLGARLAFGRCRFVQYKPHSINALTFHREVADGEGGGEGAATEAKKAVRVAVSRSVPHHDIVLHVCHAHRKARDMCVRAAVRMCVRVHLATHARVVGTTSLDTPLLCCVSAAPPSPCAPYNCGPSNCVVVPLLATTGRLVGWSAGRLVGWSAGRLAAASRPWLLAVVGCCSLASPCTLTEHERN